MSEGVIRVKNLWHKILFLVLGEENEFRSTVSAIPNIALTCKSWNQSLEHEGFWKSLYLRDFKHGLNFEIPEGLSWRNVYKSHLMDTLVVHTTFSGDLNQRITKNFWEDVEKRGSWKLNAFMGLPPRLPIDTKKLDPLKSIILTFDFDIKGEYDLVKDQINESFNWLTELFFRPESKVTVSVFPNKEKTVVTAVFTTIIEGKTNDPIEFLLQKQRKGAWDFQKRVWGNGLIVYPMYRAIRKLKKSIELLRKPHNPKYKRISKIFQKNNSGNNENSGEENISIIELLAFAKETCGLTKNYKSVEEFKDELGEEFLKEQIDMMKKAEEKKKMEMLDFQFAQQMASDNPVKIDYNDDYYSYGSNTKEREKKFDRRQKKDRKLYTRRTYTSQLDVRWMKFFSEFRTENLKLGFNVPIEQGNYEWTKREQFKNLFKNVGGLRRWMITNRRGSSLSINFDQSPLPLISFYFTMMNMEDPNAPQEEQRLEDGTTREQFQEFEDIARQKMDEERKNRGQHPSYDSMWEYGRGKLLDDIEKYSEGDDYSTNALNDESEKDTK